MKCSGEIWIKAWMSFLFPCRYKYSLVVHDTGACTYTNSADQIIASSRSFLLTSQQQHWCRINTVSRWGHFVSHSVPCYLLPPTSFPNKTSLSLGTPCIFSQKTEEVWNRWTSGLRAFKACSFCGNTIKSPKMQQRTSVEESVLHRAQMLYRSNMRKPEP